MVEDSYVGMCEKNVPEARRQEQNFLLHLKRWNWNLEWRCSLIIILPTVEIPQLVLDTTRTLAVILIIIIMICCFLLQASVCWI